MFANFSQGDFFRFLSSTKSNHVQNAFDSKSPSLTGHYKRDGNSVLWRTLTLYPLRRFMNLLTSNFSHFADDLSVMTHSRKTLPRIMVIGMQSPASVPWPQRTV